MQLRDLPDDGLRLVFEAFLKTRYSKTFMLKTNLPLLAVCRRWRRPALTGVYSDVAICYEERSSSSSGPDNDHTNGTADEHGDVKITPDLDLVVTAGCVQTVKRVDITVNYKNDTLSGFDAVIRLMRTAAEEWKGVRQLATSVYPVERMLALRVNAGDYMDGIKNTCAALPAIMPRIRRVSFYSFPVNPVVQVLSGQLAVLYSDRLESLHCYYPIAIPPDHTFGQLKSVSISYSDSIDYQHPRVDPAKLVSLNLTSWPSNHSWAPFSAGDSSGVIEFPNLKKLKLSYRSTRASDGVEPRHPDGHPWRLHFPRLGKLDVSCDQDRCPLLEYAVFPPHMYEISINAATSMLMHVAEMTLSASENLKIAVSPTSNGDPAALATANRILKGARESKRVELRVSDRSLPVLPESITCTSLTALSIDADTSVDTVLGLIRMLPNLGSLHIWHLTLHDIQEDISVPGPDEARLVEPFNARIKEMSIEASLDGRRLEMLVPVAKYLLLRTPALTRFWSEVLPRGPIEEFFNAYSKRYPHLSSIICVLKSTYD